MDCNSVKEITGLPYASNKSSRKEDGSTVPLMHACGHDAHVTWMLGVAKIMANLKSQWKGTIVFVAQPAEELLQGALAMVNDGMYEKGVPMPSHLVGLHTWPAPVGTVINGPGIRSAGSDQLDVTFYGIGGHGSAPGGIKDPVVLASMAIIQYQTIISRNVAPQDAAVLTVSSIHAGTDYNVIPSSVRIKLNLRWFSEKTRSILLQGIERINEGLAIANDLPRNLYPKIEMQGNAYPLINDTVLSRKINTSLSTVVGAEKILVNTPPIMGSEDFYHLGKGNPLVIYDYLFVGTADTAKAAKAQKEGKTYPFFLHTGSYEVDLSAITLGTEIGANALLAIFKK